MTTRHRIVVLGWADSVHIQRWVTGLSDRGFEIRLISPGGAPINGVETIILRRAGKLDYLTQVSKVRRLISEFKPDLVHAHYASSLGLWAARSSFLPTLVSVWGSDITSFGASWWGRGVLRHVFKRATALTATSRFLNHEVTRLYPDVSAKLSVIPFGVDLPANIAPLPATKEFQIGYLKSHRRIYGPDLLFKALAQARKSDPNLRLNMAGAGPITAELKALASSLGIGESVSFLGWLDRPEIYPFLNRQHLLAMPSRMESFGVAALEAAACGRPVVASDVGGVSEIVRDGVTGILVPSEDIGALAEAILKLSRDRQLTRKLGEAGNAMVRKEYIWSRSLDLMIELYERLIHDAKTHSAV